MGGEIWKKHQVKGKPKTAIYGLMGCGGSGGCGGCDDSILDLNETMLKYADLVDIVLWPAAMVSEIDRIHDMKDGEINLSILHGAVRSPEHEQMVRLLRKKSQIVLAFGSCASFGGMARLAELRSRRNMLKRTRRQEPPSAAPSQFAGRIYPVSEIVPVDYLLPGCPPPASLVAEVFSAGLDNKLPPRGTTLAPGKALCSVCPRNRTKPARVEISEFRRIHEIEADPHCFLAQGIFCLGPVIRSGCGETCIRINLPCRGCFGPAEGVRDTGLDFLSGLASLMTAEAEEDVRTALDALVDLSGYCYRYSPPSAGVVRKDEGGTDDAKHRQFDDQGDRQPDHQTRRAREDRIVS